MPRATTIASSCLLGVALAQPAAAHGPPASVIGVGTVDAEGPVHVPLTEGLAVRDGSTWRFVCPAVHGGAPSAPRIAGSPDAARLPGADGLYEVGRDGAAWLVGVPELGISAILGWVQDADGVWALTPDGTDRVVWDVLQGTRTFTTDLPLTGITPLGGGLEALAYDGDRLQRVTLSREGAVLDSVDLGPVDGTNPLPRTTVGTLWVVDRAAADVALLRVDGDELTPLTPRVDTIVGPVEAGGRVWVALDGALHEVVGDALLPTGDEGLTCLVSLGDQAWACVDRGLAPVTDGQLGASWLTPEQVQAPDFSLVSEDLLAACYSEWRVWANDTGVEAGPFPDPDAPTTTEPPSEEPPVSTTPVGAPALEPVDGCGCATPATPPLWAGLFALLAILRVRRTPTPEPTRTP